MGLIATVTPKPSTDYTKFFSKYLCHLRNLRIRILDPNFRTSKSATTMSFWTCSLEQVVRVVADYSNFSHSKLFVRIGTIAASSEVNFCLP
jgi:hypothetical protein